MTYHLTTALMWFHVQQETHHEMRIPERDDFLSANVFTLIHKSADIYENA